MRFNGNIKKLLSPIISRHPLSIEETGRRTLLMVFLFMNIPADIIFGIYHLSKGFYDIAIIDFLLTLIMTIFVILLRNLINGKPVYRVVDLLYSFTLLYWIKTGTGQGYASIWAMLHPLFSFYLLGKKEGLLWSISCAFVMISLIINPSSYLSHYTYSPQFITRYIPTFFMIFIFTYSYESSREKYKQAMETEQEKLLLEKEKLAKAKEETEKANLLLRDEMRMKEHAEIELRKHRDHLEDIVSERTLALKKNNDELEASEKRYRLLADNVNDLIWSADMNLSFSFISTSVYRMFGYTVDEAMNLPLKNALTPESYRKIMKIFHEDLKPDKIKSLDPLKLIILQLNHIKKDGTVFTAELKISFIMDKNSNPVGLVGITRDISDRIAMEQERQKIKDQLAQSQKMEAIGTLVGGLAHDFNNFLAGIIGSFNLVSIALKKENLNNGEYIEKYISLGLESSKRSAGLINQLLILSRKHEIKLSPLDIKDSVNHIYELCRNSFPKSIELNFHTEESQMIIIGDIVQIEQVLLNLCINASHAMTIMRSPGEKQGGTLTVTAEKVKSDYIDYIIKENHPNDVGKVHYWIRIKISDTGVGIPPDIKQKIFEPFFSTKSKNESTGLGLAISYNIIQKHGGLINVYSEPGSGSCFTVYFPVYTDYDNISRDDIDQEITYGNGTVLVIDDESVILSIAEGFLKQYGYNVFTAEGADKGIIIFKNKHSEISAVLIDLSMPGKSGIEVFQELKKIDSKVKAIISSGMFDNELKVKALEMGVKETVNKPYLASELSIIIKKVITEK